MRPAGRGRRRDQGAGQVSVALGVAREVDDRVDPAYGGGDARARGQVAGNVADAVDGRVFGPAEDAYAGAGLL